MWAEDVCARLCVLYFNLIYQQRQRERERKGKRLGHRWRQRLARALHRICLGTHSLTHSLVRAPQLQLHCTFMFTFRGTFCLPLSVCLSSLTLLTTHSSFATVCSFQLSLSLLFSFCLLMQFANRERERVANFGVDSGCCCCCCCCCSANGRLIMTRGSSNREREREREGVQRTSNGARPFCWYGNVRCVQYYCWSGLSSLACWLQI